jgi:thiol-disulfide isomerase/thioredoxin
MRRYNVWLTFGGLALLAAAVGYRLDLMGKYAQAPTATRLFETALTDLGGRPQSLSQWRGKVLIVNYWATWCHPCREEMPGFSRLQEKYRGNGVQFVGISIDTADKIIEFQGITPVSYPLLIGDIQTMANSAALGNAQQALPFTAVFDRQGMLFSTKLGRVTEPDLDRQLTQLISR